MAAKTLANKAGDRTLFLGTPNVFQLEFKTQGNELIEGVNKLKPCAVTGTSVNYAPGGSWSAYERGQPVSTVLTIRVQELEPIYATDYQSGCNVEEKKEIHMTKMESQLVMETFIQLQIRR